MNIRKFLILLLSAAVIISLLLFTVISNQYMNEYFDDYIDSTYQDNVDSIIEFARLTLTEGHQQRSILRSYVKDPIYYIEIADFSGEIVSSSSMGINTAFTYDPDTMTIESFDVQSGNETVGTVSITRENSARSTETHKLFNKALLFGAIISLAVTVVVIGIILFALIRSISNNIDEIIEYATEGDGVVKQSKIEELNTITKAIKSYRVKLALKEQVKKQKFDKLLHDTKTPLTIIKSQLEGVTDGVYEIDRSRAASMIESVDNLDSMLKNITNIIEDVPVQDETELIEIDYSDEIEKIVKSISAKYRKKGLEINFKKEKLNIKTNKELLNHAVYNLLINAYKYTNKGGVEVTLDNDKKTITVKDSGMGIAPEDMLHIFEPYYRGANTKGIKGEGLGLSNAKDNIEKAGGRIEAESRINEFTEFKIFF